MAGRAIDRCAPGLALVGMMACGSGERPPGGRDAALPDAGPSADAGCPEPNGCWRTENFGPEEETSGEGPIAAALDGAGVLHVAYVTNNSTEGVVARHAVRSGCGAWEHETLGRTSSNGIGIAASLTGAVHVAYVSLDERLLVSTLEERGAGWSTEEVADCDETSDVALVRDATGALHVAYMTAAARYEDPKLGYATNGGGVWTVELPEVARAHGLRLAVGPDSSPYVTFGGSFSDWHAERTEAGWTVTDVTESGVPRDAVAIDASGTVHVLGGSPLAHWSRAPGGDWSRQSTVHESGHDPVVVWAGDVGYAWFEGEAHGLDGDDLYFARHVAGNWELFESGRQFIPAPRAIAADDSGRVFVVAAFYAGELTCP